jgi:uncharacterized protein YerC
VKVNPKKLNKIETIETLDSLYTAAGSLRGRDAVKLFLRDLLTPSERIMLGRRILIARRILAGQDYSEIKTGLRVGITTIARVHRWLKDEVPGYEQAIAGIERALKRRRVTYESRKMFASLKRKYPLHFLLFPWPKGFGPKSRRGNAP